MLTAGGAGTLSEAMAAVFGPGSVIAGVAAVIGGAVVAVTNFASMMKNGFSWAQEALMLLGVALTAVGAIILGAPALISGVVAAVVAAVATAAVVIKEHWTEIKAFGVSAWDGIKTAWSNVTGWFSSKVLAPLSSGFRGFVNGVIGYFEGLANGAIKGINNIIKAFNRISFTVPDWVPLIGGKSWGFKLPTVSTISLPRLASGAVIPPNNEFAAILGDQTSGRNIETPESLLRSIFREELGLASIMEELEAILAAIRSGKIIKMNGREVGRTSRDEMDRMARALGV